MKNSQRRFSLRSLLIVLGIGLCALTLIITASIALWQQQNAYRSTLSGSLITLTEVLAQSLRPQLAKGAELTLNRSLLPVTQTPPIEQLHVYGYASAQSQSLSYLGGFKPAGQPRPALNAQQLRKLRTPVFKDDRIYLVRPIKHDNHYVGYLYVQASAEALTSIIGQTVTFFVILLMFMLALSALLAWRFYSIVAQPITGLTQSLRRRLRLHQYHAPVVAPNIRELEILTSVINSLLTRMQELVNQQDATKTQHKALNSHLEEIVEQRTQALKKANQELIETLEKLHQYQRQVIENEKMASLGDMVAGVAHEVNTPIGLGITASTMMLDELHQVQQDFTQKTLKASSLSQFLSNSEENLQLIYRNLQRGAELVTSFKQVAVDQSVETPRTFCVSQLINEILVSLGPRLKQHRHTINVICDPTLIVESKAGPINQILINLIINSVVHGFEQIEAGTIDIMAEMNSAQTLKIVYRDNGQGIPVDIQSRIFDPFVTTKLGQGGSGLGMHLVYNLVTQALNGSITLSSDAGNGVEFVIVFPVQSVRSGKSLN